MEMLHRSGRSMLHFLKNTPAKMMELVDMLGLGSSS